VRSDAGQPLHAPDVTAGHRVGALGAAVMNGATHGEVLTRPDDVVQRGRWFYLEVSLSWMAIMVRELRHSAIGAARRRSMDRVRQRDSFGSLPFAFGYALPFAFGCRGSGVRVQTDVLGLVPLAFASESSLSP